MTYDIPGQGALEINTLFLDLNGTLSIGGVVPEGVKERLEQIKKKGIRVLFFTGNVGWKDSQGSGSRNTPTITVGVTDMKSANIT